MRKLHALAIAAALGATVIGAHAGPANPFVFTPANALQARALNPQPLPPKESAALRGGIRTPFEARMLNPQPLPPKALPRRGR